ncbi:hypothetical protein H0A58_03235 [Alcaligenaceae bacterium]|nr:hypothetical protein [Alcaligenaceae bacterium]
MMSQVDLRQRQQGQALVLGLLLLSVAMLAFLRYFGLGQVVAAKSRQTHALDAAAYSGALVQARALNTLAYINRAHVAHQIAMAHLVTLGSWAALGGTQARQLTMGNPPAYLIGMMFGPAHGAAYQAARRATGFDRMAQTQGELAQAYASHEHDVRQVLLKSQSDIVDSVVGARLAAIQAVLAANYPEAGATVANHLRLDHDNWFGYISYVSGQQYLRSLVLDLSHYYGFLSARNDTAYNNWSVDARCPALRHQLRRRGNTELDATGRWQSADTLSYHALRSNKWVGCYYREYAMGWAWIPSAATQTMQQDHVQNPPDNFSAQDFWRWVQEATDWDIVSGSDNPLANSKAVVNRQRWQGGGLPAYFDIHRGAQAVPLGFSVSWQYPGPQGLMVSTRSAAETFFDRPQARNDGRTEMANLFHPYWQARLAGHALDTARP